MTTEISYLEKPDTWLAEARRPLGTMSPQALCAYPFPVQISLFNLFDDADSAVLYKK